MKLPVIISRVGAFLGFEAKGTAPSTAKPASSKSTGIDIPAPKVKKGHQALPSYSTSVHMPASPLPKQDRQLASTDPLTLRSGASTSAVLRSFAQASPELSAAIFQYLRVGITSGYTAVARNLDKTVNPQASALLQQIITRLDVLPDYSEGFNGVASLLSLSESMAKELLFEGAMCCELVLDKTLLPSRVQPLSISNISMVPDGDNYLVPMQIMAGQRLLLDSPTIFYVALDQSLMDAYPSSPLEPSIRAILFSEQFTNDVQRVIQRAIHPRMIASIDEDKFRKNMPDGVDGDQEAMVAYQNDFLASLQSMLNGLEPQDAVAYFDTIGIEYMNNGNMSLANEYDFIQKLVEAKLSSGTKVMPAVLGMGESQNVASTETMLFIKGASGAVQQKLNEMYSRVFTLALRLLGQDCVADFKYDAINLRPEDELEAFKSVRQSRLLELLSLGLITDEEACLKLTGALPPAGMKPLSGTMFQSTKAAAPGDGTTNDGSALSNDVGAGSAGVKSSNTKKNPQQVQK
jgi:hypothetical protein